MHLIGQPSICPYEALNINMLYITVGYRPPRTTSKAKQIRENTRKNAMMTFYQNSEYSSVPPTLKSPFCFFHKLENHCYRERRDLIEKLDYCARKLKSQRQYKFHSDRQIKLWSFTRAGNCACLPWTTGTQHHACHKEIIKCLVNESMAGEGRKKETMVKGKVWITFPYFSKDGTPSNGLL